MILQRSGRTGHKGRRESRSTLWNRSQGNENFKKEEIRTFSSPLKSEKSKWKMKKINIHINQNKEDALTGRLENMS